MAAKTNRSAMSAQNQVTVQMFNSRGMLVKRKVAVGKVA
jgi:hypothetical protein